MMRGMTMMAVTFPELPQMPRAMETISMNQAETLRNLAHQFQASPIRNLQDQVIAARQQMTETLKDSGQKK